MGKLEELTKKSPDFAKARKGIETLARLCRGDWQRYEGNLGCFRILTDPERELDLWEERGGYKVEESSWGRFVCTANKHLPWMMEQEIVPAWLRKAQVMIEVEKRWGIKCVKYSHAAVGSYPIRRQDRCSPASDVYVRADDLILGECYSYDFIPIDNIKRIFIKPDSPSREKTEAFAKRHGISVVYGFPDPEIDTEQENWYKRRYPPEEAEKKIKEWREMLREQRKEELLNLISYLKKHKCIDLIKPPRDPVAAALAEAYDKEMHREVPIGASDAITTMIELGEKERTLSPVFGVGLPPEGCLTASPSIKEVNQLATMKKVLEDRMEELRK